MIPWDRAHAPLAVWYTYSMTSKLGAERKRLGAAVPILTPNYLHGETEVRLDHILQVWHLGQQLLSLFSWKISRKVFCLMAVAERLYKMGLSKGYKTDFHSQEKEASDANLGRERGRIRRPRYISVPRLLSWTLLSI